MLGDVLLLWWKITSFSQRLEASWRPLLAGWPGSQCRGSHWALFNFWWKTWRGKLSPESVCTCSLQIHLLVCDLPGRHLSMQFLVLEGFALKCRESRILFLILWFLWTISKTSICTNLYSQLPVADSKLSSCIGSLASRRRRRNVDQDSYSAQDFFLHQILAEQRRNTVTKLLWVECPNPGASSWGLKTHLTSFQELALAAVAADTSLPRNLHSQHWEQTKEKTLFQEEVNAQKGEGREIKIGIQRQRAVLDRDVLYEETLEW